MTIIKGTASDDYIEGTADNDILYGFAGDDTLFPGLGNDTVYGGAGEDVINGRWGNDKLFGDDGDDRIVISVGFDQIDGGAGSDGIDIGYANRGITVSLAKGTLDYFHNDGKGTTKFKNMEDIWASDFADVLTGDAKANWISGRLGNDKINTGNGADKLQGGLGADRLTGGQGADTFIFMTSKDSTVSSSGRDTISDFSRSDRDRIDLSAIDANKVKVGDQGFSFIGATAFSHLAGQLRYEKSGANTLILADIDGNGHADMSILLAGALALKAGDFIL